MKTCLLALALVALSATSVAEPKKYRVQYPEDGPVPNYLSMRALGEMSADSPDYAAQLMHDDMGITKEQANALVANLAGVYTTLEADKQAVAAKIACTADSNTSDEEAYRLFDLIDDARIALYQELYTNALAYVEEGAVQPLLDRIGNGTSTKFIYAKAAYEGGPAGLAQQDLAEICKINGDK
jgi:hypothetical protein